MKEANFKRLHTVRVHFCDILNRKGKTIENRSEVSGAGVERGLSVNGHHKVTSGVVEPPRPDCRGLNVDI